MLGRTAEVKTYDAKRLFAADKIMTEAVGKDASEYFSPIPALLWSDLKRALKPDAAAFDLFITHLYIDKKWVQKKKIEHGKSNNACPDVPFISTNDILTTWVFQAMRPIACFMPCNMRGKLESKGAEGDAPTLNHAGNYVKDIWYCERDYATPALLRKSVEQFRRAAQPETRLPGALRILLDEKPLCMVTNWLSFTRDVDIKGCEQILHMPLYDWQTKLNDKFIGCVIYQPKKGKIGLHLGGVGCKQKLETLSDEDRGAIDQNEAFPLPAD